MRYLGQWLVGRTSDVPNSPTVESGTVGIADYALSNSNFVGITFDPELLYIGSGAFRGGKLTQANVPSGVKSVGDRAFDGCPLTAVEFGAERVTLRCVGEQLRRLLRQQQYKFSQELKVFSCWEIIPLRVKFQLR